MVYAACLWSCGQGGLTLPNTAFYLDPARRGQLEAFESTVAEAHTGGTAVVLLSTLSPVGAWCPERSTPSR